MISDTTKRLVRRCRVEWGGPPPERLPLCADPVLGRTAPVVPPELKTATLTRSSFAQGLRLSHARELNEQTAN